MFCQKINHNPPFKEYFYMCIKIPLFISLSSVFPAFSLSIALLLSFLKVFSCPLRGKDVKYLTGRGLFQILNYDVKKLLSLFLFFYSSILLSSFFFLLSYFFWQVISNFFHFPLFPFACKSNIFRHFELNEFIYIPVF